MRKSHPIRRVVLAGAATVSGIVLLLSLKPASDPGSAQAAGIGAPPAASAQGGAQAAATGTFTGDAAQTQYGAVQVRLTVANGKITKAETVQAPKGGRSDQITANAVPKLNQAAVAAGSADIDAVSGATYTSAGYKESLQSALDKAQASAGASQGSGAAQAATVTGDAVQTQYGAVQVRITVNGGKISKAETVQAPKGGRSDQVTADAVPKLNQAAVAAGTADIDAVSGATYTSAGYKESLQSALDKAQASAGASQGSGAAQAATVTGDAVQTQYGAVQVRITVNGGKISKAETVQAPKGGRSDQVTADAVPKLNQAAVAAGTADIDAVSGATYTSAGYKESLQSALDKAQASAGASQGSGSQGSGSQGSGAAQARTVTGEVSQTQYGPVQVRVTVAGGKITKAEAVQTPKGGQSDQVTANAVPKLNQAAVAAGSADIDAVSGATYTSAGYKESLQSALDQAGG
ncbi:FMN-binding protein [Streptomyces muensis]|uniref:FMN-binding protein n=1 Tax=Streptomyces muensis TaxID=1077944 RepID=A0A9X1PVY3_STRM4|nr:FMN-binding protein [Streptomyces muensis]MCF1594442.1 FMN-binding protein [Streptomyces muensis]